LVNRSANDKPDRLAKNLFAYFTCGGDQLIGAAADAVVVGLHPRARKGSASGQDLQRDTRALTRPNPEL